MTSARTGFFHLSLFAFFVGSFSLRAEPPVFDGFHPAGAERGTSNTITAVGKFDAWPAKVWVSEGGVTFTAETNKGKFSVRVAMDAVPGPRLIRLYNDDGTSEPRMFVVGSGRESSDAEPNNHFAKPQRVKELPITINGRLDRNGDVDSFALDLDAGQWLDARVDCYMLMSKADAVLRLVTTNGHQLAWNHDFTTLDPRLAWRATNDGPVVLQFFGFAYPPGSDIGLTGGESTAYRLHLAVTNTPAALCEKPTEKEPNHAPSEAQAAELPLIIDARIGGAEDEDRFQFRARTNEFIEARVEAATFGSPLDAWLRIEDLSGRQIARSDDAEGSRDPRLDWKVTNQNFVVAVGSVTHRGGADFCYRLTVRTVQPDYRATLSASSLVLTPGMTNELKIDVKRLRGFTNALAVSVRGLPEGVTLLTTNLPDKEGLLKFVAVPETARFQGAVQIVLRDKVTGLERLVPVELTTRGETGYAQLLVEQCDDLWLTVRPKKSEQPKKSEAK